MEAWTTEYASEAVLDDVEAVIEDLHGCDGGPPQRVLTSFTGAKGSKDASGVKFNDMTTDEGVTICIRVQREDETLIDCIKMF